MFDFLKSAPTTKPSSRPKRQEVPKLVIESPEHKEELLKLMGASPRSSPSNSQRSHRSSSLNSSRTDLDPRSRSMLVTSNSDIKSRSPKMVSPEILKIMLTQDISTKKADIEECTKLIERARENYNFLKKNLTSNESLLKRAENKLRFFDVITQKIITSPDTSLKEGEKEIIHQNFEHELPTYLLLTKPASEETSELHDLLEVTDKLGRNIVVYDAKLNIEVLSEQRLQKSIILSGLQKTIKWMCKDSEPILKIFEGGDVDNKSIKNILYDDCYESLFISGLGEKDFELDLSSISICEEDTIDGSCRVQALASADILLVVVS